MIAADTSAPDAQPRPDPVLCVGPRIDDEHNGPSCGRLIDPTYAASRALGIERWCPGRNPCSLCAGIGESNRRAGRRARALDRARLPLKHRGWSFDNMELQRDEHTGDFMRRLRDSAHRTLGVLRCNAEAVHAVEQWSYGSLFLHGGVGTSKTTLAAAITERLAVPVEGGYVERTDDELRQIWKREDIEDYRRRARCLVQTKRHDVQYIDEHELMSRVSLGWSGDKDPLLQVTLAPMLVLDDLGSELDASLTRKKTVAQAFEQLIGRRYDDNLPIVITSNLSWGELTSEYVYGRRVADRLREMVEGNHWELRGPSWRNPPPREEAREPGRVVDRKTAASGDRQPALFGGDG